MSRIVSLLVVTTGITIASPLAAAAAPAMSPFSTTLPGTCARLATVPRSATIATPLIAAHVSVANCLAENAMNAAVITPDAASVARLDAAVKPSVAMLDEVIALHDPYWMAIAEDAKRDLFESMIVRERTSTLFPDLMLESSLLPWHDRATEARHVLAKVIRDQPSLASRDPVIANVVRDNERTDSRVAHAQ